MKCPNCRKTATPKHFNDSPECASHMASLCAIYRNSKRSISRAGGRPKILKTCESCGWVGSTTDMKKHKCGEAKTV